ncbi:hypothetical protein E7742_20655 [Rhodococcus sp. SGAir0479]|nr:hypothetical protein E7742_20655 [Rhodococcus sp. SGAir0479]
MSVGFGHFQLTGQHTFFDLVAATTNALNGALLARRPDHYRNFTVVGILLMGLIGGIGGGISRDVMLAEVPVALINPAYITLCLAAGMLGYSLAFATGQLFREGLFQFMTSASLPWYAVVGAMKATEHGLPVLGALAIAIVGPTAGRYIIDVSCGVTPKQLIRGEWFVFTAFLTGAVWLLLNAFHLDNWIAAPAAVLVGFTFRMAALYRAWEEPLAREPDGAYIHDDGRPLLGRKLHRKSRRELEALGLVPPRNDGQT